MLLSKWKLYREFPERAMQHALKVFHKSVHCRVRKMRRGAARKYTGWIFRLLVHLISIVPIATCHHFAQFTFAAGRDILPTLFNPREDPV